MSDDLDEWIAAELAQCASAAPGALHVADVDEHRRALTLLQEHRAALRALFTLVEDGTLVRNIASDGAPGWAVRQIPLVKCLAETRAVLAGKP